MDFVDRFDARYPGARVSKYDTLLFPDPEGLLTIEFLVRHQQLLRTEIHLIKPYQWIARLPVDLPTLLEQLGRPDEVLMLFGGPPLFFDLYLVYADQGMMISYYGIYQNADIVSKDTPLLICLQPHTIDLQQVDIWIEDPLKRTSINERLSKIKEERDIRPLWDIERIGGLSITDFTDFFLEHPQECLPLKSASELREMGYIF
jgi:hypothetical protein